jgi:hypothetical protein
MRTRLFIISILLFFGGCEPNNPCRDLKNGIYQYPELSKNHNMTPDEVDRFMDLPQDIADCISTEGLIESILTYPYIGLIFAGYTGQSGYNLLKRKFRGPDVLESRIDRGKSLLKKYKVWNPLGFDKSWESVEIGRYMSRGVYLEVLISQFINLENLDSNDFKTLFSRSLEIFDAEKSEIDYYGYFALQYCSTTVARMMYMRNYEPFMSLYQTNEWIFYLTESFGPCPDQLIDQVHELALTFYETL